MTDKLVQAHYQHVLAGEAPVRKADGAEVSVFSGSSGEVTSPVKNYAPVTMVELRLQPGARIDQELPAAYNGFIVVLEDSVAVGPASELIGAGQVAWLTRCDAPSTVSLVGGEESGGRAILFAGLPLGEPGGARGPFVMNTEEELDAAFAEFRALGESFGL